jgi:hypothetical protein
MSDLRPTWFLGTELALASPQSAGRGFFVDTYGSIRIVLLIAAPTTRLAPTK